MAEKVSSVIKRLLCVLKLFRVTGFCFGSVVSGFGYDPKNPPPFWIIWVNNPFLDFTISKETKYPFSD